MLASQSPAHTLRRDEYTDFRTERAGGGRGARPQPVALHPVRGTEKGRGLRAPRELKRDGKIRDFGVSVETMEEAAFCVQQEGVAALQVIFNIFRQKPIHTLFAAAKERKVALLVRLPLASGLLGGRMTKATKFPASDHRNFNRDGQQFNVGETFAGLPFAKGVELADALKPLV